MKKFPSKRRWLWWFTLIAAVIIVYNLCENLSLLWPILRKLVRILSPFIGGFVLAFFLHSPTVWLEKHFSRLKGRAWSWLSRPLSLLIVYAGLLGLLVLLVYLIIPTLVTSLTSLIKAMPGYLTSAQQHLEEFTRPGGLLDDLQLADRLQDVYQQLLTLVQTILTTENLLSAFQGVLNVTTSLVDIVLAVIVSVYMLAGWERLGQQCRAVLGLFIKEKHLTALQGYALRIGDIFYRYFYGALLDALVLGFVVSIGLLIFQVPYAVAMGMLLGIMNMVPYFGAVIGCVGIVLVTLLSKNLYAAIGVAIYLVVVQQLDANVLQPRVVGGSVGLRPIYVLLGVTVFSGLMGFWGVVLAVPLMAVIQMLIKELIARKQARQESAAE